MLSISWTQRGEWLVTLVHTCRKLTISVLHILTHTHTHTHQGKTIYLIDFESMSLLFFSTVWSDACLYKWKHYIIIFFLNTILPVLPPSPQNSKFLISSKSIYKDWKNSRFHSVYRGAWVSVMVKKQLEREAYFNSWAIATICSTRSWCAARSLSNASCFFLRAWALKEFHNLTWDLWIKLLQN